MSEEAKDTGAFEPGQVELAKVPLVGATGRAELELAAAALVRVCQVRGNWDPVALDDVGPVLIADVKANNAHAATWRQPIVRPDFVGLVTRGFARWHGTPSSPAIEFTDKGRAAMARWVKPREVA